METSHVDGHRHRLRERFTRTGADGLHDYEVMELLLTFAIPRKDVKPIAKELLERFGGLAGVFDSSALELAQVPHIGPAASTLIRLMKEVCAQYLSQKMKRKDVLTSPELVIKYASMKLAGLPHEAFMVIYLNVQNEVIDHGILNEGTVDQVAVYPRRIIEMALTRHAGGIILVHNHPSGHVTPSEEDKQLTRMIMQASRPLDIRVLDHIVIGRDTHFSFLAQGLI